MVIGNFDGVHRGHLALFTEARRLADDYDARVVAVTFTSHPVSVLRPGQSPAVVMHRDQREQALHEAGADEICWLEPTQEILSLSPRSFIERMVSQYQPMAVVEGQNFHFGHRRQGDPKLLKELGKAMGFEVFVADLVRVALADKSIVRVSSTLVRWLLGHGRVGDVTRCMGRAWQIKGQVVPGEKRGRTLGAPTANLDIQPQMLPADGVYAGRTQLDGRDHLAALSVGTKPTFGGTQRICEAFVLDQSGDLYGQTLSISLLRYLRDQWAFADADALRRQIDRDVKTIVHYDSAGLLDPADTKLHIEHVMAHE